MADTSGRKSGRASIRLALTTTMLALVFLAAGLSGYTLSRHDRFVSGTAWSDSPIWWQVGVGLVLVPVALFCWRRGLRGLSRR